MFRLKMWRNWNFRCDQVVKRGGGGAASSDRRFSSRGKGVAEGCKAVAGGRFQGKPGNPNYAKRSKLSRR